MISLNGRRYFFCAENRSMAEQSITGHPGSVPLWMLRRSAGYGARDDGKISRLGPPLGVLSKHRRPLRLMGGCEATNEIRYFLRAATAAALEARRRAQTLS